MSEDIRLTVSDMEKIVRKLVYEQKLYDYTKLDYIDIGVDTFKTWLKETKNLKGKFPMSYLINKYFDEFTDFIFANRPVDEKERFIRRNNQSSTLENWGQEIVSGNVVSDLPTMGGEEFFTKKIERFLPRVWQMMEIPEWLKIELSEPNPSQVKMGIVVDYPKMIKSNNTKYTRGYDVLNKFKEILTKYFGVTFGRVIEGNLLLQLDNVVFNGFEEWLKKDFNKELKKEIKSLPGSGDLHSMKFEPPSSSDFKSNIKLVMRKYTYGREIRNGIEQLLRDKGYSQEFLRYHS